MPGVTVMQHCEECGSELRDNARFCGHCGKRVDQETEATTNLDDSSTVDIPVSPLITTTVFSELQDSAPENDVEKEKETPPLVLENDVEEEQQLPQLILENDVAEEEQTSYLALENDVAEEEQTQ